MNYDDNFILQKKSTYDLIPMARLCLETVICID